MKKPKLFLMESFGLNGYIVSTFHGGSQVIGQLLSVSSQSKRCDPEFSSSHKDHWINHPSVKIPSVP